MTRDGKAFADGTAPDAFPLGYCRLKAVRPTWDESKGTVPPPGLAPGAGPVSERAGEPRNVGHNPRGIWA